MRHIGAPFLVFLVLAPLGCGPHLPSIDMASQPEARPDAAPVQARPDAGPVEARPDAGPLAARPEGGAFETRADVGSAEARPEVGAADARPEVGAADARPEVGTADVRADAGPPEVRAEAAAEAPPDLPPEAPSARAPRAGELRIAEVLVDPDGNDLGHEWFEIVNVTREALSLADLHVADGATDVAVQAGLLGAGARLVLGQSLDRAHNGDAPVDVPYGTRLALNNDADRIAVCLGTCEGGVLLDQLAWTEPLGTPFVGHAAVVDLDTRALCPAPALYGTAGNFGSPGAPNPPCPL